MWNFSIWSFLAWLAMFVLGMNILEDTIKLAWYAHLKKFLSKTVNTNLKAIGVGTIIAGILQSGTIVSVMVLSFVWAGVLSLWSAIWVIIWANVWGTFLWVLIAKLGFGYSISARAIPLLAIGWICQYIKHKYIKIFWTLLLWFGLLLFGISFLKDSVSILAQSVDISLYASMGWYVFFVWGIVGAALLHSSGTATIIAMVAMQSGIMTFEQAVITMLGASIGSSLIWLYVSYNWSAIKKQVAYSHVLFNICWSVLFLFFVPFVRYWMWFIVDVQRYWPDALAIFQVIYNIITALLIFPWINHIATFLSQFDTAQDKDYQLKSIKKYKDDIMYLQDLKYDVSILAKKIFKFNLHHLKIDQKIVLNPEYNLWEKYLWIYIVSDEDFEEDYEVLKTIEAAILENLFVRMNQNNTSEYQHIYTAIQNLMNSAKILRASKHDIEQLYMSDMLIIQERVQALKEHMIDKYLVFSQIIAWNRDTIETHHDLSNQLIELLSKVLKRQHIPWLELTSLLHLTSALDMAHHAYHDGITKLFE